MYESGKESGLLKPTPTPPPNNRLLSTPNPTPTRQPCLYVCLLIYNAKVI